PGWQWRQSRIHLYGLDLGVELARSRSLLATTGARALHSAKGRMRVDTSGVSIHAHEADVNSIDVIQRSRQIAREDRCTETIGRVIRQFDCVICVLCGEFGQHRAEQFALREQSIRIASTHDCRRKEIAVAELGGPWYGDRKQRLGVRIPERLRYRVVRHPTDQWPHCGLCVRDAADG